MKAWKGFPKAGKNLLASRHMFDELERLHPIREAEKIKVENIQGKVIFVGAEDDVVMGQGKDSWRSCTARNTRTITAK